MSTKPRLDVYCHSCKVCCVPEEKEARHNDYDDEWTFEMTCWRCGTKLATIVIKSRFKTTIEETKKRTF